jgi:hypothetical protein
MGKSHGPSEELAVLYLSDLALKCPLRRITSRASDLECAALCKIGAQDAECSNCEIFQRRASHSLKDITGGGNV